MREFHETYVTKRSPTLDDWLDHQSELFTRLKAGESVAGVDNAPLVDVQNYAAEAGVEVRTYFTQLQEQVGPLGRAALHLVDSQMDDAYHVVVGPSETPKE